MDPNVLLLLILAALLVSLLSAAINILKEYERGVIFTLGRFTGVRGPGFILIIPGIQKIVRVDLRTVTQDVPTQDVISRDNVSVQVNAVIYFRVVDPEKAILEVEDYPRATSELAQTTLRSVLGKHDLDEMLAERDKLNQDIQEILDAQTDRWGIKVSNVEIKHVDLDESMVRAIAKQAEAERIRRAKVINARGEEQAAQKLADAAHILSTETQGMQLRYLASLQDIAGGDKATTIVFPFPMDVVKGLIPALQDGMGDGEPPRPKPAARPSGEEGTDEAPTDADLPPEPGITEDPGRDRPEGPEDPTGGHGGTDPEPPERS